MPRLWAKLIDKIIIDLGFKACKHEPCLYHHLNYNGQEIYFIRQVDDFAIGCKSKKIDEKNIDIIDGHATVKTKHLGVITKFNGVDIHQTRNYIQDNNEIYIHNILEDRLPPSKPPHTHPILITLTQPIIDKLKKLHPLQMLNGTKLRNNMDSPTVKK